MTETQIAWREFLAGVKGELPILVGVIPFGMIYGILALGAGLKPTEAQAMSAIVFAGSAQFMLVQMVSGATPALVMVLTGFVINLRHALYSASVAPYLGHLRAPWKALLAYLLTDEAYAVTITHYNKGGDDEVEFKHWYFLGAGLALWTSWQISSAVGIFLGTRVPPEWSLDFTLALTFIALVIPALEDRASVFAAVAAGATSILAFGLPYKLGLLTAALVGIIVGLWGEER
ncbi:MAG: AzlC family ABC transporter permease [Anaerolineales bacterium]|nr:AzlC family ABC transporter permease [Chloroflexota bacterium]MBL6979704.1 AzlC family ABC transporter permease [Anaerolineales bacterium]